MDVNSIIEKGSDFIKDCILRSKELGLEAYDIYRLLRKVEDTQFIKQCIDKYNEYNLDPMDVIVLLLNINDVEYVKECIENNDKYRLPTWGIADLLRNINDEEYTKKCIDRNDKYRLPIFAIERLLENVNDPEYIKKCIDRCSELEFDSAALTNLIMKIDDSEYIKKCIEKFSGLGFESCDLTNLIIKTNDVEYIKQWIESPCDTTCFLKEDVLRLVGATKDSEYIKPYIEDEKDTYWIVRLLKAGNDVEYIKQYIKQSEKFGFMKFEILELIAQVNDEEYTQKCKEELELDEWDELEILTMQEPFDEKKFNKYLEKNDVLAKKWNNRIKLPKGMTIGVELETEGKGSDIIEKLVGKSILKNWNLDQEYSLYDGVEITSPILYSSDSENATKSLNDVCNLLNALGQETSERCGGHIHIGADFLTSVDAYMNLKEIYGNCEDILYIISNEKGNIPREGVQRFAHPVSKDIEEAIEQGEIDLKNENDLDKFINEIKLLPGEPKYYGVSLKHVGSQDKNTVEFRISNGTITDGLIDNINLWGRNYRCC